MANELRKIGFNMAETQAALEILAAKTGKNLPEGNLEAIQTDKVGGTLALKFGSSDSAVLRLREKDITTALLIFCQQNKIPVPKEGQKALKAEGDNLILLIKF